LQVRKLTLEYEQSNMYTATVLKTCSIECIEYLDKLVDLIDVEMGRYQEEILDHCQYERLTAVSKQK